MSVSPSAMSKGTQKELVVGLRIAQDLLEVILERLDLVGEVAREEL